jgi:hypothetical protein
LKIKLSSSNEIKKGNNLIISLSQSAIINGLKTRIIIKLTINTTRSFVEGTIAAQVIEMMINMNLSREF